MSGKLYIVGTPIGNLGDFSPRAVETLCNVDFIAAEDTRVTVKLLNHFGIKVENRAELEQFIGPPLRKSFMEGFGFEEEKADEAVVKYRERFVPTGMYENEVYEGMETALQSLKEAGKRLIVATSKPEHMAKKILAHFKLDGYFDDICGSCDDSNRNEKDEVIRYALEKHGIESEIYWIGTKPVQGCMACNQCVKLGRCVVNDDVNALVTPRNLPPFSRRVYWLLLQSSSIRVPITLPAVSVTTI